MLEERKPGEFAARRKAFGERLKDHSFAVLYSGVPKICSADEEYPFEANRNFYYLTGIVQDGSILLVEKHGGKIRETLFVTPFDEKREKWTGKRLSFKEASAYSGIQSVLPSTGFEQHLDELLSESKGYENVYFDFEPEQKIAAETSVRDFRAKVAEKHKEFKQLDLYPIVTNLRLSKSPYEVELFKKAVEATRRGIEEVAKAIAPGKREFELAGLFRKEINDANGYQDLSFATIMASGRNAATLHYTTLQGTLKEGDLLLMDLGARYGYYCADVSRTFPVSGKFNDFQRNLYSLVLKANKNVMNLARPGLTPRELQNATKEVLAEGLIELGIIKAKEELDRYYFHGVSHFIGLDTHDPYQSAEGQIDWHDVPLVPGAIISDEPGVYIPERNIGIRIEDDLLITESGCVNLTSSILKEIDEIEAFMANR